MAFLLLVVVGAVVLVVFLRLVVAGVVVLVYLAMEKFYHIIVTEYEINGQTILAFFYLICKFSHWRFFFAFVGPSPSC